VDQVLLERSGSSDGWSQTTPASLLSDLIETRMAGVGIIGMGYVGLPLALAIAGQRFPVVGFDIDPGKVETLNAGQSYIRHIPSEAIAEYHAAGRFSATSDFARLAKMDVILICVPTPLNRNREPDLSHVVLTTEAMRPHLRRGQLIALESTTFPGTTTEIMRPILEASGLRSGVDFFLAYSPEREDPGNLDFSTSGIPKVVGGDGPEALKLATALYSSFVSKVVPVSTPETAEAVKLTENIFRAVNIALVNELKVVFEAMGIDVWEVIEAAKTKPFGYMAFYPGPGLGGHCIPIDPFYLTWRAREYDIVTHFIELAGEINTRMPYHVVERVIETIDRRFGRGITGARVLILGIAYKKNIDDIRESPSLKLIELLEARGATVNYHDALIPMIPPTREHAHLAGRCSVPLDATTIAAHDAVLIATDHDGIDYAQVVCHAKVVVDTRGACRKHGIVDARIVKA
jgi:UDP-N-acetyl-D-glucosamine dehydrogenase